VVLLTSLRPDSVDERRQILRDVATRCDTSRTPYQTSRKDDMTDEHATDRIAIAEMINLYAEAVDVLGCAPVAAGDTDQALEQAARLFGQCLADDAKNPPVLRRPAEPRVRADHRRRAP